MKKLLFFLLPLFAAACQKINETDNTLQEPQVEIVSQGYSTFTASWDIVDGAASYDWKITGTELAGNITENEITVDGLKSGDYMLCVRSVSDSEDMASSEWAEIPVKLEDLVTFTFEVKDITSTSATTVCIPSDQEAPYWFDVRIKSEYDSYGDDEEFIAMIESEIRELGEMDGLTYEETLEILLSVGTDEWKPTSMKSDTDYIVYAFGINYDASRTSDLYVQVFRTNP